MYVDGSIDAAHMSVNSIDSDSYVDGSIDAVHLSANSVDSDAYVDASIDNAHLADDAVGVAELSATGTASSSTFLRGDNAWAAPSGGSALTGSTNNTITTVTGADAIQGEANLTFDGTNLSIAGTGDLILGSGGGISFAATGDGSGSMGNELFDNYEEGSWTPAVVGGTKGIDTTYHASYTLCGNRVHITLYADVSASGDGTQMKFSGLPYAVHGDGSNYAVCRYVGTAREIAFGGALGGGSEIKFFKEDDTHLPQNEIGHQHIIVSITYMVG
jgi:hypothetical protein